MSTFLVAGTNAKCQAHVISLGSHCHPMRYTRKVKPLAQVIQRVAKPGRNASLSASRLRALNHTLQRLEMRKGSPSPSSSPGSACSCDKYACNCYDAGLRESTDLAEQYVPTWRDLQILQRLKNKQNTSPRTMRHSISLFIYKKVQYVGVHLCIEVHRKETSR